MNVLITGSDGSLGRQLCEQFSDRHWGITNKDMQEGKSSIENNIIHAIKALGPITHVVNNYGINHLSWIGETKKEDEQILMQNVMTAYWVINYLVELDQVCRVVNVASATYRVPQRCTTLYCASKAAMVQMTKVMARELAPKGWIINAIAPGLIEDTKMAKMTNDQVLKLRNWDSDEAEEYAMKLIPMQRPTKRKEVAQAIIKIFELPDYINGSVIDMMGGV